MPITEEIQIECFKKYNFIVGMPKEGEFHPNKNPFYQCCLLYWYYEISNSKIY